MAAETLVVNQGCDFTSVGSTIMRHGFIASGSTCGKEQANAKPKWTPSIQELVYHGSQSFSIQGEWIS
jgi:hypothetical protein